MAKKKTIGQPLTDPDAPAAYTISGPSIGPQKVPVTLMLTREEGWAVGDVVSLTDYDDGKFGTFVATPGHTGATVAYTPASIGERRIFATNNREWRDPAAFVFTVPGGVAAMAIGL